MELNRELQNKILIHLASIARRQTTSQDYAVLLSFAENDEAVLAETLLYLEAHDLLTSGVKMCGDEPMVQVPRIKIRKEGRDRLEKDGGLTAEKKVITVRFHEDTFALLEACITQSDIAPQAKQDALKKLRELPASAIEHLLKQLLDAALLRWPDALQLIRSLLP